VANDGHVVVIAMTSQTSAGYDRVTDDTKAQLLLFLKLFVVMGLSWFSDVIHIELHGDHQKLRHCNFHLEARSDTR
jgi:hypothetical protein